MADEQIRLLACQNCRTIEELPDFNGPAEYDTILQYVLAQRHQPPHAPAHIGQLFKVDKKHWQDPGASQQIAEQISLKMGGGETGLGHTFYDTKNNLVADAFKCWQKDHNRVKACPDYKSDSKLLTPDTKNERREEDMGKFVPGKSGPKRWLCEFCPVHSLVQQAQEARKLSNG
jgi:hypothetical protein